MLSGDSPHAIEHDSSRSGRWLRERRTKIALLIAAVEALLVAVLHDVTQWTVIVLAAIAAALYWYAGRNSDNDTFRHVTWIFAVSQLLAVVAAIFAFVVFWAAIIAVAIFAVIALVFIFTDRR